MKSSRYGTPEQRFWKKVDKDGRKILDTRCWEWTGAVNNYGCARFWVHGKTVMYASRFSYELHYDPIPEGQLVCHRCDNPVCVNPDHLFLGNNSDNRQDCMTKGRLSWQKLTVDQVRVIKRRLAGGDLATHIARDYKMTPSAIYAIAWGKTWSKVA